MHQARIILAIHGFEASVAQAPALRQTTAVTVSAHPEPEAERVVKAAPCKMQKTLSLTGVTGVVCVRPRLWALIK